MSYLGIDGGGSKTTFLLCDETGRQVFRTQTGPSNWISVGEQAAAAAIAEGATRISTPPNVICGGFAGAGRVEGAAFYLRILQQVFPKSKIIIETDAFIAYVGAIGIRPGVLLVAGTGSIAIGRTASGTMIRNGGWGPFFGDEGGGFWIGREAIRAALQLYDEARGTNEKEPLAVAIERHFNLKSLPDIVVAWSTGTIRPPDIAALFPHLVGLSPYEPLDRILRESAAQLRRLATLTCDQVDMANAPLSFAGSIASHDRIQELIGLPFQSPRQTPEWGAILWARHVH
jgi:N-acetylglucosamine kinase-like BadF-type ATPase